MDAVAPAAVPFFKYINPYSKDTFTFSGTDATEAEEFIHAVRQRAFSLGNGRDNDWIVDFTAGCFVGEALRWHVELDDGTKWDWGVLQKAIMERWPRAKTM
jgi:hypothetical protein